MNTFRVTPLDQLRLIAAQVAEAPQGRLAAGRPMFEGAPASVAAGWAARTLAPHFASLCVLPTDFYTRTYSEASYLNDRAIWRVPLASKEAPGIEPLNHNHIDEVTLCRGCTVTCPKTLN